MRGEGRILLNTVNMHTHTPNKHTRELAGANTHTHYALFKNALAL